MSEYVTLPRADVETVTQIANRNEQSAAGDRLAVMLSSPPASIPAEIGELVERLEKQAASEPAGMDTFYRRLFTEAASAIRALSVRNGDIQNTLDNSDEMLQACRTELETVKGELVRAWNAFGPPSTRKDTPAWDVGDLEHLSRSANGGLDDQIRELEDQLFAAEAKLAGGEAVKVKPSIASWAEWCQPGDQQQAQHFLVRFDDPDRGDAVFTDWQEARDFYCRATNSWNCWFFAAVPVSALTHPVHMHNDGSGEAEPGMVPPIAGWVVLKKSGDGLFMSAADYDQISAAAEADIHDCGYFAIPLPHTSGEVTEAKLLIEMGKHLNWELDWGSLDPSDECSEAGWRVHKVDGGRNDREWTLIGSGDTPAAALEAALRGEVSYD